MDRSIYRDLMKHLGKVGTGYHQHEEFLEVLEKFGSRDWVLGIRFWRTLT